MRFHTVWVWCAVSIRNGESCRGGLQVGLSSVGEGCGTEMYPEDTERVSPAEDDEGENVHGTVRQSG